jgi:hypothetical protein
MVYAARQDLMRRSAAIFQNDMIHGRAAWVPQPWPNPSRGQRPHRTDVRTGAAGGRIPLLRTDPSFPTFPCVA